MIANPKPGDRVQVWYAAKVREFVPHHGCTGTVAIASKGRPRNHGIRLDVCGTLVVVPCGNLRKGQA